MMARFSIDRREPTRHAAAVDCLWSSLRAVQSAASLLVLGAATERDRGLGVAILRELQSAERSLRAVRSEGSGQPSPGFALTELLWVVAVLAILSVIAWPGMHRMADRLAVRRAGNDLVAFYHHARFRAIFASQAVEMDFAADSLTARFAGGSATRFAVWPGPQALGVSFRTTRRRVQVQPTGVGWGAANTKLVLRRGAAADSFAISRLGRIRRMF